MKTQQIRRSQAYLNLRKRLLKGFKKQLLYHKYMAASVGDIRGKYLSNPLLSVIRRRDLLLIDQILRDLLLYKPLLSQKISVLRF